MAADVSKSTPAGMRPGKLAPIWAGEVTGRRPGKPLGRCTRISCSSPSRPSTTRTSTAAVWPASARPSSAAAVAAWLGLGLGLGLWLGLGLGLGLDGGGRLLPLHEDSRGPRRALGVARRRRQRRRRWRRRRRLVCRNGTLDFQDSSPHLPALFHQPFLRCVCRGEALGARAVLERVLERVVELARRRSSRSELSLGRQTPQPSQPPPQPALLLLPPSPHLLLESGVHGQCERRSPELRRGRAAAPCLAAVPVVQTSCGLVRWNFVARLASGKLLEEVDEPASNLA
eukprot:scaffold32992_cov48-Phaeocystis_antarctica.AAC.2